MTLIERLQRHLSAGTIGTVRAGKSGISDDHTGLRFFCTFYCASPLTDTGDHGSTFDEALTKALDKLDAKIGARLPVPAAPLGLPQVWGRVDRSVLPGLPMPSLPPLPKGPTNA